MPDVTAIREDDAGSYGEDLVRAPLGIRTRNLRTIESFAGVRRRPKMTLLLSVSRSHGFSRVQRCSGIRPAWLPIWLARSVKVTCKEAWNSLKRITP